MKKNGNNRHSGGVDYNTSTSGNNNGVNCNNGNRKSYSASNHNNSNVPSTVVCSGGASVNKKNLKKNKTNDGHTNIAKAFLSNLNIFSEYCIVVVYNFAIIVITGNNLLFHSL